VTVSIGCGHRSLMVVSRSASTFAGLLAYGVVVCYRDACLPAAQKSADATTDAAGGFVSGADDIEQPTEPIPRAPLHGRAMGAIVVQICNA